MGSNNVDFPVITAVTQGEEVLLFIALATIYMIIKARPEWINKTKTASVVLLSGVGFWTFEFSKLGQIAWFFTKAGAFVFASGLAIIPFLHGGVVTEYGWLSENQFIDSVAVAMITPGPVVITVGFIGYLVAGFPGACVAAAATFLPCYLFTVIPTPYFKKIAKNKSIRGRNYGSINWRIGWCSNRNCNPLNNRHSDSFNCY